MRLGIRLQIVLAVGALLVLAFVPLFVAVSSLTQATLRSASDRSALASARTLARSLHHARNHLGPDDLRSLTQAETSSGNTLAVGFYDEVGRATLRMGRTGEGELPKSIAVNTERVVPVTTPAGPAVQVFVPVSPGSVGVLFRREDDTGRAAPLLRLVALYTGLFAVSLLVFAYIALTRLIVHPLDAISASARRVAAGARRFDGFVSGPAELTDLAASLGEMTEKLKADEQSMREQITALERGARALKDAQDQLIRSERLASVGRLAAGLAHEIGNPLAALMGLEDLLLAGDLTPAEERDFLTRIRSETERIHGVLRQILDFARPATRAGSSGQEPPGAVSDAVADVLALVRPQKGFRDVTLEVDVPKDLPPVLLGHEAIMQVLLNLLLNAADAIEPKGHIWLSAQPTTTNEVRIRVADDGPGVDAAVLPRLFEPFVSTKEVGKGTGLGLAVCRGLVESVHGTIALDPQWPQGAAFVVTLPTTRTSGDPGPS